MLVNIDVPGLDRGIAFYTAAFGLVVSRRFAGGFVELGGAAAPIFLLEKKGGTPAAAATSGAMTGTGRPSISTSRWAMSTMRSAVRSTRVRPRKGDIRDAPFGQLAMFADPFGHGFCLIAFNQQGYGALPEIS